MAGHVTPIQEGDTRTMLHIFSERANAANGLSGGVFFRGVSAYKFLLCRETSSMWNTGSVDVTHYPRILCDTDACGETA